VSKPENSPLLKAGRPKIDKTLNLNALKHEEINSVDLAFSKRPHSPENFRIYEDKDVNGPLKCVDFVAPKYRYNQALI